MSFRFVGLEFDCRLSRFRPGAKHLGALIVVVGMVAHIECGARKLPSRVVVSVVSRPRLPQRCDSDPRLPDVLTTFPQVVAFGDAVGGHLGVATAGGVSRRFSPAVTGNSSKSDRKNSASDQSRS